MIRLILITIGFLSSISIAAMDYKDNTYDSDQEVNEIFKSLTLRELNRQAFYQKQQLRFEKHKRRERIKKIKENLKKK